MRKALIALLAAGLLATVAGCGETGPSASPTPPASTPAQGLTQSERTQAELIERNAGDLAGAVNDMFDAFDAMMDGKAARAKAKLKRSWSTYGRVDDWWASRDMVGGNLTLLEQDFQTFGEAVRVVLVGSDKMILAYLAGKDITSRFDRLDRDFEKAQAAQHAIVDDLDALEALDSNSP